MSAAVPTRTVAPLRRHGAAAAIGVSVALVALGSYLVHGTNSTAPRTRLAPRHAGSAPGRTPRAKSSTPFRVVSLSPAPGTTSTDWSPVVSVVFSDPVAADSSDPVIEPVIPGSWRSAGRDALVFTPSVNFPPGTEVTVSVAAGPGGPRDSSGQSLTEDFRGGFAVPPGSTLRLQQLLAELGYLPLSFTARPTGRAALPNAASTLVRGSMVGATSSRPSAFEIGTSLSLHRAGQSLLPAPASSPSPTGPAPIVAAPSGPDTVALAPQQGTFTWRYPNLPAALVGLWIPGTYDTLTRGAVMAFQADHGLDPTGVTDAALWRTLLSASAAGEVTTSPYDFLEVSETLPENLQVWQDGHIIYRTLANTGIDVAPTETGIYPVYLRFVVTTMSGFNPNGSYYSDPGIPWVAYFNGGDAVHGFLRYSYGFPQSLGCVELPYANAAAVYHYDQIGTLVDVE